MSQSISKPVKRKKKGSLPRLTILLGAAGLALLLGGLFWVLSRSGSSPAASSMQVIGSPSLKVDQEKIDLGDVKLGEWVDVRIKVTNAGDQILVFAKKPYIQVVEGC